MQQKIMNYIDHVMILLMLCFLKDFFLTNTVYTPKLLFMNIVCAFCLAFFVPTFYAKLFEP
ncbi:MAG: hypothetical protein KIG60_04695 [Caryophanon sp.]|nr:hypothetical protein [Caryophanon sp.]